MKPSSVLFAALGVAALAATTALANDAAPSADDEELAEIVVIAPEPRYVAPTTRDRIGRVWVPVHLDGKGPFRMVLDTAAQRSAVVPEVAQALGIPLEGAPQVLLHGATGSRVMPTIRVETLAVGDVWLQSERLPIVPNAFGGAEGLLGMDGMRDRRIYINFRADYVDIARSNNRRAGEGFLALPFIANDRDLIMVNARVGGVAALAIIDTGAQTTVGNAALHSALRRRLSRLSRSDEIHGATGDVQTGTGARVAAISLGGLAVRDAHVTFGDIHIFQQWELTDRPVLLVGMDILGLVDTLVIDYRRRELQIKPRGG